MLRIVAASPSKNLLASSLAFVAGIVVHAWDERRWSPSLFAAAAAAFLCASALVPRRLSLARLLVLCAGLVLAGIARYDVVLGGASIGQEPPVAMTRYVGTVIEGPKDTVAGAILSMDRVFVSETRSPVAGPIELRYRVPVSVGPGDVLAWECRLKRRPYDGVPSCMPADPPEIGERVPGFLAARALMRFKDGVRGVADDLLPEPHASLLLGLLLGDKGGLPRDLVDDFRRTGTAHVLAVSGYNVRQLVETAFIVFALAAVRRKRAAVAVAITLGAFVVLTGAEASVVRAAIMGGFGIVSGLLGRRNASLAPLALAAAAMLCHDPSLLRHDVGFRLSFAAVVGMQAFGPELFRRLGGGPDFLGLKRTFADTVAASLATMPISLGDFGVLPLAGPVVNLLVIPLVPLVMAAGAAALLLGALWLPLGWPPAFVGSAFSGMMIGLVEASSAVAPVFEAKASAVEVVALFAWLALLRYALAASTRDVPSPSSGPVEATVVIYAR